MALPMHRAWQLAPWTVLVAACTTAVPDDSTDGGVGGTGGGTGGTYFDGSGGIPTGGAGPTGGSGWYPTGGATTGGAAPTGGALPTGGAAGAPNNNDWISMTFDFNTQGWTASYAAPTTLAPVLSWVDSTGNPSPGALRFEIPFTGPNQTVRASRVLDPAADLSWGVMNRANVRLVSGLSGDVGGFAGAPPTAGTGSARLFARSGSVIAFGEAVPLDAAIGWITLTMNVAVPASFADGSVGYDPTQVVELGVEIDTGATGVFTDAVVTIDSIF
jgi:hypothetical protein